MYRIVLILCISLVTLSPATASDINAVGFHKAPAIEGDGVYSLLRRYELVDYPCNISKFYELNEMTRDEALIKGKKYTLPIYIYNYNGKSIRSSIDDQDWDKAVRIQNLMNNSMSKT